DDCVFALDTQGAVLWHGAPVGRLGAGETALAPRVEVRTGDFLAGDARERVRQRLQNFVKAEIERRLAPLFALQALPVSGAARGVVYQLTSALGCIASDSIASPLDRESRRALARVGVRFGSESVYLEPLLGPEATRLRALLWATHEGRAIPAVPG